MLNLLYLTIIVVIIIDLSGVVDSIKSGLKSLVTGGRMRDPNYSLKPIDCSFCITFWSGLIYLLITNQVSWFMLAYLLGLCVMTPVIKDLIVLVRECLIKIIRICYEEVQ